jgi:uncharacterized protein
MLTRIALPIAFVCMTATTAWMQQYPKPSGYVNDFAGLLSHDQGAVFNSELAAFEKRTTVEIAVVTVPSLKGHNVEDYTRGLAKEWGVGKAGKNNGVVFLIAPNERKMRIETATGIRSILTDGRADQIRDEVVLPRFRNGDIPQGIIDGAHAIMNVLDQSASTNGGDTGAASPAQSGERDPTADATRILEYGLAGGIIAVLLFIGLLHFRRRSRGDSISHKQALIAAGLKKAERLASNADVSERTRKGLEKLKGNPVETPDELDAMNGRLDRIVLSMKREIAFSKKARQEGPKLLRDLPSMIDRAEKKLAKGKRSKLAALYLREARTRYSEAQRRQAGMTPIDWNELYLVLSYSAISCAKAERTHFRAEAGQSFEPGTSGQIPGDSGGSFGFGDGGGSGDGGGFGGGGGFDGGGSSGSW